MTRTRSVQGPWGRWTSPRARFDARIVMGHNGCWQWVGKVNKRGYGRLSVDGREQWTHRLAYEWFKGSIPEGLEIDHLCRNPSCCNPAHLEAVTHQENIRRGAPAQRTECLRGHPYTEENTRLYRGKRSCEECRRAAKRAYYWRQRAGRSA